MTDTIADPFNNQTEQVNYLEVAKTKFHGANGELDIEGLARGKYESDKFINQLQAELAEARKKAEQGMAVKDLLEVIKSNPPGSSEPTLAPKETSPTAEPADISQLVKDTINQTAREQRETTNKATVVAKLNEVYGTNSGTELAKKSSELGISVKRLEEIGKESPQALFTMLGLNNPVNVPGSTHVPTSRVSMPNDSSGDRTKSYYDKLYKQNPAAKYDAKIAAQEHRDAIRLGVAFFDN